MKFMKLKILITHPFTLIASFLLVFIGGQHQGYFYFQELIAGLIYGEVYSIVGSFGIFTILFCHFKYKGVTNNLEACFINLIGSVLLIISLFLFFYHMEGIYVSQTFIQIVPLISLLVFCILVSFFVLLFPFSQKDVINSDLR